MHSNYYVQIHFESLINIFVEHIFFINDQFLRSFLKQKKKYSLLFLEIKMIFLHNFYLEVCLNTLYYYIRKRVLRGDTEVSSHLFIRSVNPLLNVPPFCQMYRTPMG